MMPDLLKRYETFAKNFRTPAEPPTPIEDRWALEVKLQNASTAGTSPPAPKGGAQ